MFDFSVDGLVNAKEKVSEKLDDIVSSASSASTGLSNVGDEAEDTGTAMTELAGGTETAGQVLHETADEMQNVEDELEDITIDAQGATASITELNAALASIEDPDVSVGGDMTETDIARGNIASFMATDAAEFDPAKLFEDRENIETFISNLHQAAEGMEDVDEVFTRAEIGEALEGDTESVREFSHAVAGATSNAISLRDVLSSLRPVTDNVDEAVEDASETVDEASEQVSEATSEMMDFENLFGDRDADELLGDEKFEQALKEQFEDINIGQIKGPLRQMSGDATDADIAKQINQQSDATFTATVRGLSEAIAKMEAFQSTADEASDETDELTASILGLELTIPQTSSALMFLQSAIDEVGDEADESADDVVGLAAALQTLGPEFGNVSANIGPFNVALHNIAITIPAIIAMLGPLVAVMGALAVAVGAVVTAFGAFAAIGIIQLAKQLDQRFASIKNTTEGFTAILKGLKQALWEALAPLRSASFGGMGPIQFFVRLMRDLVAIVHLASIVLAELLQMNAVVNFFTRIEDALVGTNAAGRQTVAFLDELKRVISVVLPYVTGLAVWLIEHLPEGLRFTARMSEELLPVLQNLGAAFLHLATSLTKLGTEVLVFVLPALTLLFEIIALVTDIVVYLTNNLGVFGEAIVDVALAFMLVFYTVLKVSSVLEALGYSLTTAVSNLEIFTSSLPALIVGLGLFVAGILLVIDGLNKLIQVLGISSSLAELLGTVIGALVEPFVRVLDAMSSVGDMALWMRAVIELVVGAVLIWIAESMVLSGTLVGTLAPSIALTTMAVYGLIGAVVWLGTALATGVAELEQIPVVGKKVQQVLNDVANAIGTTGEHLESLIGVIVAVAGAIIFLGYVVTGTITTITGALVASGWGAALVVIGALVIGLAKKFGVLKGVVLAVITAITAALVSSGWGALIVGAGMALVFLSKKFKYLEAIAVASIGAITTALVGSGWGAIIVAIGMAIGYLINNWGSLRQTVVNVTKIIVAAIDSILGPLDEWINKLLKILGLYKEISSAAPVPGTGGETGDKKGMGRLSLETGAAMGAIMPGAGTLFTLLGYIDETDNPLGGQTSTAGGGGGQTTNKSSTVNVNVYADNSGVGAREGRRIAETVKQQEQVDKRRQDGQ